MAKRDPEQQNSHGDPGDAAAGDRDQEDHVLCPAITLTVPGGPLATERLPGRLPRCRLRFGVRTKIVGIKPIGHGRDRLGARRSFSRWRFRRDGWRLLCGQQASSPQLGIVFLSQLRIEQGIPGRIEMSDATSGGYVIRVLVWVMLLNRDAVGAADLGLVDIMGDVQDFVISPLSHRKETRYPGMEFPCEN